MKIRNAIIFMMIFFINMVDACVQSQQCEYVGKDTLERFGDGRFHISTGDCQIGKIYSLFQSGKSDAIEPWIINYKVCDDVVYFIGLGQEGFDYENNEDIFTLTEKPEKIYYTKINIESGEVVRDLNMILKFTEEEQEIFEELLTSDTLYEKDHTNDY